MMALVIKPLCIACVITILTWSLAQAGEADVSGLWRGSLYGSSLQARVEQEGHNVKGEVVVQSLTGETNVYHVVGAIFNGHMYVLHGSGHVFEGDAHGDVIHGVLTTKGGTRLELDATRVPLATGSKAPSSGARCPATALHQPG